MVKDERLAYQVVELMETVQDALFELYNQIENKNSKSYGLIVKDLKRAFEQILSLAPQLKPAEEESCLPKTMKSCLVSLDRIRFYMLSERKTALEKLEFELIPMMKSARTLFYYQALVYPDIEKIKIFQQEELPELTKNPYIAESEKTGYYKYDLSVIVQSYNKLEYTKLCVESLIKFIPQTISYELILANNGSSDGTKEYFESIHPDKQYDVDVNYGGIGGMYRIMEGEYCLFVSNDVVVTENAVENMLRCMKENKDVGLIVPSTPNISNYQTVFLKYDNLEEMHKEARKNNCYDEKRHERRVRLCDPIALYRSALFNQFSFSESTYTSLYGMPFPDDRTSLLLRRSGYKLVLAKDAYCYHFGSVTVCDDLQKQKQTVNDAYAAGCREFEKFYGINPWGTGFCYDLKLASMLNDCLNPYSKAVLGINCGLGSNSLKIKEILKEKYGNFECVLYNYADNEKYLADLKGISEQSNIYKDFQDLLESIALMKFDCIIWEDGLESQPMTERVLNCLCRHLEKGGLLIVNLPENKKINAVSKCGILGTVECEKDSRRHWVLMQYEKRKKD